MGAFLRKYGTGTGADVCIPIIKRGVVDFAVGADWTPAAGDVKVSQDGGAAANIGTLPVAVAMGNGAYWKFVFSDAELQCKTLVVTVSDSATKAVEDQSFVIETFGHASARYVPDFSDGVRLGLTTVPNAAAGAAGGLLTCTNANELPANSIVAGSIASGALTAAKFAAGAFDAVWTVGTRTLTALGSGLVAEIWNALTAGLSTANSIGKLLVDNVNATISSRASQASVDALPTAAQIADANWDEAISGHLSAGTTGAALNAAGSAGDPWSTPLPGAYGAGTAGNIVGNRLDTSVGSRLASASYTAPDNAGIATAAAAATDAATDAEAAATAATAAAVAATSADNKATTILNRLGAWTGSARNTILGALQALFRKDADASVPSDINADLGGGAGGALNTTDSLEAIRDNMGSLTSAERNAVADALLDRADGVEAGLTPRQHMRVVQAVNAGKTNGAGTPTFRARDKADSKDRVVASTDGSGNRTAVTLDVS
jgi:hypothetical protein